MKALAIRHLLAEHLGMMERALRNLGFKVEYLDTAKGETLKEPEFRLMEQAIKLNIPILGKGLRIRKV